jgi:hypothetical protein
MAGDILNAQDLYRHKQPGILPPLPWGAGQASAYRFREFLERVNSEFKNIIVIAGNHEFYAREKGSKKTPASVVNWFQQLDQQWDNFHFFYRRSEVIDGVRIEVSRPSNSYTFRYEDTVQTGSEYDPNFLKEVDLPFNSPASVSAQGDEVDERIHFRNRKTAAEVTVAISEANLTFLRTQISVVIAKLQNWLIQNESIG